MPYVSIFAVAFFVLGSNLAHAAEAETYYSEEIMDLDAVTIADVVSSVGPYTPNYEEDSVQTVLAMKDSDFLEKPVIAETHTTEEAKAPQDRKSTITYTVDPGDTLSSIGWKYGLKIATIKAVNGLTSENIKPGQKLQLPPADVSRSYLDQIAAQKKKNVAGASSGGFGRPTSGWNMSQPFGHTSFERWHTGIDLTSRSGTTIFASASGRVTAVRRGWGGGYGNHIIIDHGNGFSTLYGHLSSFKVSQGQYVNKGQVIAIMGNTGWSTGVHVHFEIRKNGVAQNPMNYL